MPARVWVPGSDDPLSENHVDDEEEHHTGSDENVGGDRDANIMRIARPDNPHNLSHHACHAETEQHSRHEELVALPLI